MVSTKMSNPRRDGTEKVKRKGFSGSNNIAQKKSLTLQM